MDSSNAGRLAFKVEETASRLAISRASTYRLIASGELGSIKVGRSRRVTAEQLDDYLGRLTNGAA